MIDKFINSLMREAIEVANAASTRGELPYGAVISTADYELIASAHDQVEMDNDLTSHAELLAIRAASEVLGRQQLQGCILISTVEPCYMCFGAAWTAGLSDIVFGVDMRKLKSLFPASMDEIVLSSDEINGFSDRRLSILGGILADECLSLWSGVDA